jgi:hypothetical protein
MSDYVPDVTQFVSSVHNKDYEKSTDFKTTEKGFFELSQNMYDRHGVCPNEAINVSLCKDDAIKLRNFLNYCYPKP